ncbi:AAA family ATPase [Anaeromyxobacter paludicola]|uniref:ATPase n=1 Tax=Anaeromyxobacter paludicola TaxID=2918171 RepID=A0ABN6N513_9BACT|nr:MoxR family ATPase [Anaeromyxobacter paludicola]BDG08267.1 ATPase [Anaeromyxobacter paludicola]
MIATVESARQGLEAAGYLASREIATAVFLAEGLDKPLLVEGPAGVGKTELARAFAAAAGRRFLRLQCYEGLDEAKALYEWEYAKQLLYTQLLRDRIGDALGGAASLSEAADRLAAEGNVFFSERFLVPRPILQAVTSEAPALLLVDEVDKADPEFEAFLLEVLAEGAVTVPELGTFRARHPPRVVLTSNAARDLSDALRRRCLHLHIDYPTLERELAILRARAPEAREALARQVVAAVARVRRLDLRKPPSIAETLDWVRGLVLLGAEALDPAVAGETLSLLLKHETDAERVRGELRQIVEG